MRKLIYAALLGLVGAGIVHIAVLLMVPDFSERDAWSRLAQASDLGCDRGDAHSLRVANHRDHETSIGIGGDPDVDVLEHLDRVVGPRGVEERMAGADPDQRRHEHRQG